MSNNPNTVSELMACVAEALNNRDMNRLEELDNVSRGWVQSDSERSAQNSLLDAAMRAVEELEEMDGSDPMGDHMGRNK